MATFDKDRWIQTFDFQPKDNSVPTGTQLVRALEDQNAITSGQVLAAQWEVTISNNTKVRMTTGDLLGHLAAGNLSIPNFSTSAAYARFSAFVHNGTLYRVLTAIPDTNTFDVETLVNSGQIEALIGHDAEELRVQYSATGTSGWTTTPNNYIRVSTNGGRTWSSGFKIKGDPGEDGRDGTDGTDGQNAPEVQIQYSADGLSNWGTAVNDYIRFSTDGGESWSAAKRYVGRDGSGTNQIENFRAGVPREAREEDLNKIGIGPDRTLYDVKITANPGHDAVGTFNEYTHANFRGVLRDAPNLPQDNQIYYNTRRHTFYLYERHTAGPTQGLVIDREITVIQALGANAIWIGEVANEYQARHSPLLRNFDNNNAYYAIYGGTLYVLDNSTYTAPTGVTYSYTWERSVPEDLVTEAKLQTALQPINTELTRLENEKRDEDELFIVPDPGRVRPLNTGTELGKNFTFFFSHIPEKYSTANQLRVSWQGVPAYRNVFDPSELFIYFGIEPTQIPNLVNYAGSNRDENHWTLQFEFFNGPTVLGLENVPMIIDRSLAPAIGGTTTPGPQGPPGPPGRSYYLFYSDTGAANSWSATPGANTKYLRFRINNTVPTDAGGFKFVGDDGADSTVPGPQGPAGQSYYIYYSDNGNPNSWARTSRSSTEYIRFETSSTVPTNAGGIKIKGEDGTSGTGGVTINQVNSAIETALAEYAVPYISFSRDPVRLTELGGDWSINLNEIHAPATNANRVRINFQGNPVHDAAFNPENIDKVINFNLNTTETTNVANAARGRTFLQGDVEFLRDSDSLLSRRVIVFIDPTDTPLTLATLPTPVTDRYIELAVNAGLTVSNDISVAAVPLTYAATLLKANNNTGFLSRHSSGNLITLAAGTYEIDTHLLINQGGAGRSTYEIEIYNGATLIDEQAYLDYLRGNAQLPIQSITSHHLFTLASDSNIQVRVKKSSAETGGRAPAGTDNTVAGSKLLVKRI